MGHSLALDGRGSDVRVVPASGVPMRVVLDGSTAILEGDARVVFEGTLNDEAVSGFPMP